MEIWRDIKNYDGLYQVSNMGNVKNLLTNKLAQPSPNEKGYLKVSMLKNNKWKTKRVHRLVAETFMPNNDPKMEINHKNGNKLDNRVDNLEWVSHSDNMKHAWRTGLIKPIGRPKKQLVCLYNGKEYIYNDVEEASKKTGIRIRTLRTLAYYSDYKKFGYWFYKK